MTSPLYFDYAAATPVSDAVLAAMQPFFNEIYANPSSVHSAGLEARKQLELARSRVAVALGVNHQTVIFTAGATESINIAIHGLLRGYSDAHFVTTAVEHEAVLDTSEMYATTVVPVDERGFVSVDTVIEAITDETVLVSVMYANNEVGTIQPISDIARAIQKIRKQRAKEGNARSLWLHTDASQVASYLHVNVPRLGVDLMTLNGGKMYGPKQSGILYISRDVRLKPMFGGGGQERGLRGGTENVAAAIGFATALEGAQAQRKSESVRIASLRNSLEEKLQSEVKGAVVNGHPKRRLPNSLNITIPGIDGERAVMMLDEKGLQVATGSACSASSDSPSHVLRAMGLSDEAASASLRITFGLPTTEQEVAVATRILLDIFAS